jgi:exosortase K
MTTKGSLILKQAPLYLFTILLAVGLKYHYSTATSDGLAWILGPTAGVVELLTGIEFQPEEHTGFVNWPHRMIIAKACAGVNFLIVALCLAIFSRLHRVRTWRGKIGVVCQGLFMAYLLTVAVNALRITAALLLHKLHISWGWLTPQRLHRLTGTAIFFICLCLFYLLLQHLSPKNKSRPSLLVPLCFYLSVTLLIPLLNALFHKNSPHLLEHTTSLLIIPTLIILLFSLPNLLKKKDRDSAKSTGENLEGKPIFMI